MALDDLGRTEEMIGIDRDAHRQGLFGPGEAAQIHGGELGAQGVPQDFVVVEHDRRRNRQRIG